MTTPYDPGEPLAPWAYAIARDALATSLPRRWSHVQGVAELAKEIAPAVAPEGDLLIGSCALAGVGFAPQLKASGFPQIDGARYLDGLGVPHRIQALAANYFASAIEAELRGFGEAMSAYRDEGGPVRDALWYCDIHVGPDGERTDLAGRLGEARVRYAVEPVVLAYLSRAEPDLRAAVERTELLMEAAAR